MMQTAQKKGKNVSKLDVNLCETLKYYKKKYFFVKHIDEIKQSYYISDEIRNEILQIEGEMTYDLHHNI